ncbi:MAG: Hsp33 family molecular chaperone HslO, partial [Candidatus Cloacimonetes bacterium]|nr:Hsp33 family molecular chaperone HslO [Candidatus Cloacimonadota bacterium]
IMKTIGASYKCNCSREKFSGALELLEKEELLEAITKTEDIVTECHFCNTTYAFSPKDIKEYLDNKKK